MFKSLQNKRLLSLVVLTATLFSMTLGAANEGVQAADNREPGNGVVDYSSDGAVTTVTPVLSEPLDTEELVDLVGPVALYPDDLLAIVLPASAYPLQIVQAARFLEALEEDDTLKPDEAWDESVVALLNYPEVIELMNNDLEWTWQLGEAVLNQEPEVIAAVETFRDRAVLAGNLETDEHQTVESRDGTITIPPVEQEVIYVPYYEPERVVVYQPYPVYHYYPRAYPLYYYPYPVGYHFDYGFFWGITTAFTIGWHSNHLNLHYSNYYSHPYYGHTYFGRNHYYHRPSRRDHRYRDVRSGRHDGDRWRPGRGHGARPGHRDRGGDRHGDNTVVRNDTRSRFQQSNTFKPRPGFQRKKIGIPDTPSGQAAGITDGTHATLKREGRKPDRLDRTRQSSAKPGREVVSQNRKYSGKSKRIQPVSSPDRNHAVRPSRTGPVRLPNRKHSARPSRPDRVAGNPPRSVSGNLLALSGSHKARSAPLPKPVQRPVSRSPESRPARVASNRPAPRSSNHGRSRSAGNRGQGHREGRIGRQ